MEPGATAYAGLWAVRVVGGRDARAARLQWAPLVRRELITCAAAAAHAASKTFHPAQRSRLAGDLGGTQPLSSRDGREEVNGGGEGPPHPDHADLAQHQGPGEGLR